MKEIKSIIEAFERAHQQRQKTALATVVHVEGSSYRAPGARMLITEDGSLTGAISGGCLEGDALRKALMVIMQDRPLLVTYHTTDEDNAVFGINLGCNGTIRVLIEPVDAESPQNPVALLKAAVSEKLPSVLVIFFSLNDYRNSWQGTRLLIKNGFASEANKIVLGKDAHIEWPFQTETYFRKDIKEAFEKERSLFINYHLTEKDGTAEEEKTDDEITAFLEYLKPDISLVIAGAGNDVFPVVQMAGLMGWSITLIDGRPAYANTQRFPACQILIAEPEKALLDDLINQRTACLIMSHNYHYDKAMLRRFSQYDVPYIGMLGPRKKFERIMNELREEGILFSPAQQACIHSPVGLDIGAETPEGIACSIIAEINAVFSDRTGKSLRTFKGAIHHRKTEMVKSI